jgi:ABC-type polysaccharide/polyol phosphate export permease
VPVTAAALRPISALYRARELLALLVARDLKSRYKRSVLGMFWTLLGPLLQMAVYTLVFTAIVRIRVPAYAVFVLSGLLPWMLLSGATLSSTHALLANQHLIRKVAVPQAVYPLALVGGKTLDLLLSLAPLALVATLQGRPPSASWLFLPVAIVVAVAFTAGLSLLAASLTVFFRDLRHLAEVGFQVWLYVTPILYPRSFLDALDPRLRLLLAANPAAPIVRLFQAPIHEGQLPATGEVAGAVAAAALALGIGLVTFVRSEDRHLHWF